MILIVGIKCYQAATASIECWWGVLYPPLGCVGFEENSNNIKEVSTTTISALDPHYLSIINSSEVHYKIFILEWLHNIFSF